MKLTKTFLILAFGAGSVFAQNPVAHTRAVMKGVADAKNASIQQALAPQSTEAGSAQGTDAQPATKDSASAAVKGPHRDPFVSPIVQKGPANISCTGGKKCLSPNEVMLQGVVSSETGKIAVVMSPAKKAYFLREKDPVLNGYVVRITADSIVFRENVTDRLGKVLQKEVVKKVSAPAV